jgi:hypothetical protein
MKILGVEYENYMQAVLIAAEGSTSAREMFRKHKIVACKDRLLKDLKDNFPDLSEDEINITANSVLDKWTAEKTQLAVNCLAELQAVLAKHNASISVGCGENSDLHGVYDEHIDINLGQDTIATVQGWWLYSSDLPK